MPRNWPSLSGPARRSASRSRQRHCGCSLQRRRDRRRPSRLWDRRPMARRERNDIEIRDDEEGPGAIVSFPFDAAAVERFRDAFPRARWNDDLAAWRIPGTTAMLRVARWLDRELPSTFTLVDERGRDSFSSSRSSVLIWKPPTRSSCAPLIHEPSSRNCARFRGRGGTEKTRLGTYHSARSMNFAGDGRRSRPPPNAASQRLEGNGAKRRNPRPSTKTPKQR